MVSNEYAVYGLWLVLDVSIVNQRVVKWFGPIGLIGLASTVYE